MFDETKNELLKDIILQIGTKNEKIAYDKIEDALEKASKDIVYNHLIYKEDVTYEKFLNILKSIIQDEK